MIMLMLKEMLMERTLTVQEEGRRILQIFGKKIRSPGNHNLNVSWPSNFLEKI